MIAHLTSVEINWVALLILFVVLGAVTYLTVRGR